jgi:hypothetical protein
MGKGDLKKAEDTNDLLKTFKDIVINPYGEYQ